MSYRRDHRKIKERVADYDALTTSQSYQIVSKHGNVLVDSDDAAEIASIATDYAKMTPDLQVIGVNSVGNAVEFWRIEDVIDGSFEAQVSV